MDVLRCGQHRLHHPALQAHHPEGPLVLQLEKQNLEQVGTPPDERSRARRQLEGLQAELLGLLGSKVDAGAVFKCQGLP